MADIPVVSDIYFKKWNEYSVSDIRKRYRNRFKDLSSCKALTNWEVCEALTEAATYGTYGLIIPSYKIDMDGNKYDNGNYFWNTHGYYIVKGKKIPTKRALDFMRFAKQIDITKRRTTLTDIKEGAYTPRKLFRKALSSDDYTVEDSYRGIGWWDPKQKAHKILPFHAIVEGEEFKRIFGDEFEFDNQRSNAEITVPSISRYHGGRKYAITMRVLPVTDLYNIEWLMLEVKDGCEDRYYRERARQKDSGEIKEDVYRYVVPEDAFCRHCWGGLLAAEERSYTKDVDFPFRVKYPRIKPIISDIWKTLNLSTIIKGPEGGERRPIKTEANVQLWRNIKFLGPDGSFDLTE